jgi:NDP-sugar pyrophosphorylase family protein
MAAGMGSRFGGLKQIAPMGPNDEFIIDYSIYDAIKAGFSKVVFIIKEENYEIFKETIGSRVEPHIPVEYVFQKLETIPDFVEIPEDRQKQWGTAHAIYCAKDAITEPFLVINADDFYGRDAFMVAKEFLEKSNPKEYATIAYKVVNTMTENGSVKRGVTVAENENLKSITESKIEKIDGKINLDELMKK